jgi:hypothetical protein
MSSSSLLRKSHIAHGVGGCWVALLVLLFTSGSVPRGGLGFAGFFSSLLTAAVIMIEVKLR